MTPCLLKGSREGCKVSLWFEVNQHYRKGYKIYMKTLTKQECDVAHLLLIIIYFIVRVKDKLKYDWKKFILFIPSNFFHQPWTRWYRRVFGIFIGDNYSPWRTFRLLQYATYSIFWRLTVSIKSRPLLCLLLTSMLTSLMFIQW